MLTLVLPSTSMEKFAPVTVLKVTFILPVLSARACPLVLSQEASKGTKSATPATTLALQLLLTVTASGLFAHLRSRRHGDDRCCPAGDLQGAQAVRDA